MKYFDVFEHPMRGVRAIKHGFSWPGFFFGVLWALFHQLWLPALLLWLLGAVIMVMGQIIFHSILWWVFGWAFCGLAIGVFAGFTGNEWRRSNVSKRGFRYIGTKQAATPDAAIAEAIRKRRNDTVNT